MRLTNDAEIMCGSANSRRMRFRATIKRVCVWIVKLRFYGQARCDMLSVNGKQVNFMGTTRLGGRGARIAMHRSSAQTKFPEEEPNRSEAMFDESDERSWPSAAARCSAMHVRRSEMGRREIGRDPDAIRTKEWARANEPSLNLNFAK